jgi:hypothetical protein
VQHVFIFEMIGNEFTSTSAQRRAAGTWRAARRSTSFKYWTAPGRRRCAIEPGREPG